MTRSRWVFLVTLALVASIRVQGISKEKSFVAADFFPLDAHRSWTYQEWIHGAKIEKGETYVITVATQAGNDFVFSRDGAAENVFKQDETGVFSEFASADASPRGYALKNPIKKGTSWSTYGVLRAAGKEFRTVSTGTISDVGLEITVPAGHFKQCIKVVTLVDGPDEDFDSLREDVYAPGVGLIKTTGPDISLTKTVTSVLVRYRMK